MCLYFIGNSLSARGISVAVWYRKVIFSIATLLLLGACSQNPPKSWEGKSTISPGWQHIKKSASDAIKMQSTWIPVAGAIVFGGTQLDRRVSNYAQSHTPVYGSREEALRTSDIFLHASASIYWATTLAVPMFSLNNSQLSLQPPYSRLFSNSAAGGLAVGLTNGFTGEIKRLTKRNRPNKGSNDSLPSAHASSSTILTNISRSNIHILSDNSLLHWTSDIGLGTMAGATAWARVEGGVHFPSDVLLGIGLANFFANFVNKAFLNPKFHNKVNLNLMNNVDGPGISINFKF